MSSRILLTRPATVVAATLALTTWVAAQAWAQSTSGQTQSDTGRTAASSSGQQDNQPSGQTASQRAMQPGSQSGHSESPDHAQHMSHQHGGQASSSDQSRDSSRTASSSTAGQSQAWLGVMLSQSRYEYSRGVRITDLHPNSPAVRAGLRPGDVILRIEDHEVSSADDVISRIHRLSPNHEARLVVLRDGREQTLQVKLGDRSQFASGQWQNNQWQSNQWQSGPWQGQQWQSGPWQGGYWQSPPMASGYQGQPYYGQQDTRFQQDFSGSQNQRIESMLHELRSEVQQLRQEVVGLRQGSSFQGGTTFRDDSGTSTSFRRDLDVQSQGTRTGERFDASRDANIQGDTSQDQFRGSVENRTDTSTGLTPDTSGTSPPDTSGTSPDTGDAPNR